MAGLRLSFLNFASNVLQLREVREGLIAANIANSGTPGYKAVDIDFPKALAASMDGSAGTTDATKAQYLQDFPVGLDGNDVSLTAEKLEAVTNNNAIAGEVTYLHQATSDLITALRPNNSGV